MLAAQPNQMCTEELRYTYRPQMTIDRCNITRCVVRRISWVGELGLGGQMRLDDFVMKSLVLTDSSATTVTWGLSY